MRYFFILCVIFLFAGAFRTSRLAHVDTKSRKGQCLSHLSASTISPPSDLIGKIESILQPTSAIFLNKQTGTISTTSIDTSSMELPILQGGDGASMEGEPDARGGLWVSFQFPKERSQHDVNLGKILTGSRLLCFSRIKRWWQAPFFASDADAVPVETQMILIELNRAQSGSDKEAPNFHNKMYAVLIPLIDFDRGFRVTLFGKEGGAPAGGGILAARSESGDPAVRTKYVRDALYVSTGTDPYELMDQAFNALSQRMQSFRTRLTKPVPDHIDTFGFCTWDAFYSSVDGDKVKHGVESLIGVGVEPKFVIIDDGWQSTGNRHEGWVDWLKATQRGRGQRHAVAGGNVDGNGNVGEATVVDADVSDGDLSGVTIRAEDVLTEDTRWDPVGMIVRAGSTFYADFVQTARADAWSVKLWRLLSKTVIKNNLLEFFATRTDFTKTLISVKANAKFEDADRGTSLKSLVSHLKDELGLRRVFVWHALGGYWGGVSEDENDALAGKLLDTRDGAPEVDLNDADMTNAMVRTAAAGASSAAQPNTHRNTPDPVESAPLSRRRGVERVYPSPTPHLLWVEPELSWDPSSLAGSGAVQPHKLSLFYKEMHAYLAAAGVDGVKVDAQSGIGAFGRGRGGGSAFTARCVQAVEKSVREFFPHAVGGGSEGSFGKDNALQAPGNASHWNFRFKLRQLISRSRGRLPLSAPPHQEALALTGCMCHSTDNLFNFYETSMVRASDDFYPKDAASHTVHVASCAYNSVMLGEICHVDWDMFHSQHPCAELHAAARAISGGPIYVSDAPGNHDVQLLQRLVLPGGHVLRPSMPGRPTIDCLFKDCMSDGKTALKVWSRNASGGALLAVFNVQGANWCRKKRRYVQVDEESRPTISAEIRPADVPGFAPRAFDSLEKILSQQSRALTLRAVVGATLRFLKDELKVTISGALPRPLLRATAQNSSHHSFQQKGLREQAYVAWSARTRKLHMIDSRISSLMLDVEPYQWDLVSMQGVQSVRRGRRSVLWAPIGLLDMLNAGGGVQYISQNLRPLRQRLTGGLAAAFTAVGSGRFGVYVSDIPRQILVDGVPRSFTYTAAMEGTTERNLVEFDLPHKPDTEYKRPANSRITLKW